MCRCGRVFDAVVSVWAGLGVLGEGAVVPGGGLGLIRELMP